MQWRFRCSNEAEPGDFMIQVIFRSLRWISPESAALSQWNSVISSWINWNTSWFHWPKTSHKLQLSQLPNQHRTTWAVTSTAQWADCFWECRVCSLQCKWKWKFYFILSKFMYKKTMPTWIPYPNFISLPLTKWQTGFSVLQFIQ